MIEMDLETNSRGLVVGRCQNCGQKGHEHDRIRVQHDDGRYSYDYYCSEEAVADD